MVVDFGNGYKQPLVYCIDGFSDVEVLRLVRELRRSLGFRRLIVVSQVGRLVLSSLINHLSGPPC